MAKCLCGCGEEVIQKRKGRTAKYLVGHVMRGRRNLAKARPDSTNARTLRWRTQFLKSRDKCELAHLGGCKGVIDIHHIDKNVSNNSLDNLASVCRAHHRLLDNKRITMQSDKMPDFYVDKSGKRRYAKSGKPNGDANVGDDTKA